MPLCLAVLLLAPLARPQAGPAAAPADRAPAADEALPPGEEQAAAALARSPRHGEWIDVPVAGGGGARLRTWVVYPERKDKAPVVIV
ncbi:MAG TPA: hypothetical protein VLI67_09045, partial [Vicinamibacteria bacterium]|nr:hypothetical protein [Vicinamibacteria bacterium]